MILTIFSNLLNFNNLLNTLFSRGVYSSSDSGTGVTGLDANPGFITPEDRESSGRGGGSGQKFSMWLRISEQLNVEVVHVGQ